MRFDPTREITLLLQLNLRKNRVTTVDARHAALSDRRGEVDLFEGAHTAAGSVLEAASVRHRVPAMTLDDIVADAGHIDLLKLDIEGAEFAILEQASRRRSNGSRQSLPSFTVGGGKKTGFAWRRDCALSASL